MSITDQNYEAAPEMLVERHARKRSFVQAQKIWTQPAMKAETATCRFKYLEITS